MFNKYRSQISKKFTSGTLPKKVTITFCMCLVSLPASAQQVQNNRQIDRVPEDYRPEPIYFNAFELSPTVGAEIEYVDNLFLSDSNRVDDTIVSLSPELVAQDRRQDREIGLSLKAELQTYLNGNAKDRLLVDAAGSARFGLGTLTRTSISGSYKKNDTQGAGLRNSGTGGQPLTLTSYKGSIGLERDLGSFTASANGDFTSTSFNGNNLLFNNVAFDSSYRDFETLSGSGKLAYEVTPAQRIYSKFEYNDRKYQDIGNSDDFPSFLKVNRSSTDASLSVGYRRELTRLISIDVSGGYITQDFEDNAFSDVSSLTFNADIFWEPTQLTTISLRTSRSVDTTNDPLFTGLLRSAASISVRHELRRNLIIGLNGRYAFIDIEDGENGTQISTYATARYYLSKNWSFELKGEYFDQDVDLFPGKQSRLKLGIFYAY